MGYSHRARALVTCAENVLLALLSQATLSVQDVPVLVRYPVHGKTFSPTYTVLTSVEQGIVVTGHHMHQQS